MKSPHPAALNISLNVDVSVSSKRLSFCLLQNQMDLYKMTVDSVGIHNDQYNSR